MGYLVSQYRSLFPQGLFDAPKEITTWDESHRLFAQNQIKEKIVELPLSPGLTLTRGHKKLKNGGFFNFQCVEIDPSQRKPQVVFFNEGEFPLEAFKKTPRIRFLTTLGYFYFTTNPKADEIMPPDIKVNNLFIQKGQLFQLPVLDRSAFIIFKNGSVEIPFIKAQGTLRIGKQKFTWRGARTSPDDLPHDGETVVYNGSAGIIKPYDDPIMGPGRLAKKVLTPKGGFLNLIISQNDGKLRVSQIQKGQTEVTKELMILCGSWGSLHNVKEGDILDEIIIDGLKQTQIFDAVSVGPRIFPEIEKRRRQLLAEGLDDDKVLCNRPHRENLKLARAFLIKLENGNLVSVLIDGIPQAGNIYPGVTPQEAADFIFSRYPNAREVVATDPGGTMKSVYKDNDGQIKVFGNMHYLDYRYKKDGSINFWPNGRLGRKAVTFLGVF